MRKIDNALVIPSRASRHRYTCNPRGQWIDCLWIEPTLQRCVPEPRGATAHIHIFISSKPPPSVQHTEKKRRRKPEVDGILTGYTLPHFISNEGIPHQERAPQNCVPEPPIPQKSFQEKENEKQPPRVPSTHMSELEHTEEYGHMRRSIHVFTLPGTHTITTMNTYSNRCKKKHTEICEGYKCLVQIRTQ